MFAFDSQTGLVVTALIGGSLALFAYGSYAGDWDGYSLLALTGALSGIAYWLRHREE